MPTNHNPRNAVANEQSDYHPNSITNLLTPDLVRITVGDPVSKTYHIHRALLCALDPIFSAGHCPQSCFAERHNIAFTYPDQLPQVVDLFVAWVYSNDGGLPYISVGGADLPVVREKSLPAYIHLYNLAELRCIDSLQTAALKEIVRFYRHHDFFVLEPTLCLVYEITLPKCQLRTFMARAWYYHQMKRVHAADEGEMVAQLAATNTDFGEDLVDAITEFSALMWKRPDAGF